MWAHSENRIGDRQLLSDHLGAVARLAGGFGETFAARDLCYCAGLLHDVGKADPEWQRYLAETAAGGRKRGTGPDHKCAGAQLALSAGSQLAALLIHGHHGGLGSPKKDFGPWFAAKRDTPGVQASMDWARTAMPEALSASVANPAWPAAQHELDVLLRLAYSALVDADTVDSEAHDLGSPNIARGSSVSIGELWERYESFLAAQHTSADTSVNRVRADVLASCLSAADGPPGLYRLTVPTGGGKTRSGLAFALRHALRHSLRRVIVAVPFTTITEQTADVYRQILESPSQGNTPAVLEHHSAAFERRHSADPGDDFSPGEVWQRLAAENWDAPVVVTTTVQLFESLFSNRRSATRKVHNIAGSVIILDEAQALPHGLLAPILDAITTLAKHCAITVVLCTATQPAFEAIPEFADLAPTEIVPEFPAHFHALRRVSWEWRCDAPHPWGEVAGWMNAERQALAIVNTKAHAQSLLEALDDPEAIHLSTRLCGAHRLAKLTEIQERLQGGRECRVVSTQVVEAGVDLDFPAVFRALGPLDSVIQAAGRCNREGLLPAPGRMVVFEPEDDKMPPGPYRTGAELTRVIVAGGDGDLSDPAVVQRYSHLLLGDMVDTDAKGIQELRRELDFPEVAQRFRMIDQDTYDVVVTYGTPAQRARVDAVLDRLRAHDPAVRGLMRELQPFLVSLYAHEAARQKSAGFIEEIMPQLGVWRGRYDPVLGLVAADPEYIVG